MNGDDTWMSLKEGLSGHGEMVDCRMGGGYW